MDKDSYWFPAKTYGWGWGFPVKWQGWVVMAAYIAGMVLTFVFIKPHEEPLVFFSAVTVQSIALVFVCWKTGEPPRWRWGKE